MYLVGKEFSETDFYRLVVNDEESSESVKNVLSKKFSDNNVLKEKLETLDELKKKSKVGYFSESSNKLFGD